MTSGMRDSSIADSADIKFACSQCGQRMVVERSGAGHTADCPVCKHPVTVPLADVPEESGAEPDPASEPPLAVQARQEPVQFSTTEPESELEQARAEITRQHALFKKAVDECER